MPMSSGAHDSPAVVAGGGAQEPGNGDTQSIARTAGALRALAARVEADPDSWADSWECPPELVDLLGVDLPALVAAGPGQIRRLAAALEASHAIAVGDERGVSRALRRVEHDEPPEALPALIDAADFWQSDPPSMDWVLPGVLPAGQTALIVGSDGAGKSLLALELVLAVALGVPWACRALDPGQAAWSEPWLLPAATPGRALYIGGEDDTDEYHRKFRQIAAELGLPAPPQGQIAVLALDGQPLHLMTAGRQEATPQETVAADALRELIIRVRPRLVVADPLIMCHALNENDSQHMDSLMRLFIRLARAVPGCAVVVVHHAGQDAIRGGSDDHLTGRGSTGLNAAARAVFTLRNPDREEKGGLAEVGLDTRGWRRLRGPKISRGPALESAWLAFDGGVLVAEEAPIGDHAVSKTQRSSGRGEGGRNARTKLSVVPDGRVEAAGPADVAGIPVGSSRSRIAWADDGDKGEASPDDTD